MASVSSVSRSMLISQMLQKNFNHLDGVVFDVALQVPRLPGYLPPRASAWPPAGRKGVEPGPGSWISIWNSLKISNGHGAPVPTSSGDLALSELIYRVSSPTDSL